MGKRNREEDLKDLKMLRTYVTTVMAAAVARAMPGMESRADELDAKLDKMDAELYDFVEKR